jgi:hypothetical protein
MSDFSVSDAGVAGLRLVGRKPLTVAAWGLFVFVAMVVPILAMLSVVGSHVWSIIDAVKTYGEDSHEATREVLQVVAGVFLLIPVMILASLIGRAMLVGAVFRAVIEPKNSGFAYLRLGSQELWIVLVLLVGGLLLGLALGLASIPVGIASAVLLNSNQEAAAFLVGGIGHIAVCVLCVWLALRFSMAAPLSFVERRFALFESWDFTRGHAGRLFFMALLIVAVIILMEIVVGCIIGAVIATSGMVVYLNEDTLRDFFSRPPQAWMGVIGLIAVGVGLLMAVVASIFATVAIAPWAVAYKALAEKFTPEPGVAGLSLNG